MHTKAVKFGQYFLLNIRHHRHKHHQTVVKMQLEQCCPGSTHSTLLEPRAWTAVCFMAAKDRGRGETDKGTKVMPVDSEYNRNPWITTFMYCNMQLGLLHIISLITIVKLVLYLQWAAVTPVSRHRDGDSHKPAMRAVTLPVTKNHHLASILFAERDVCVWTTSSEWADPNIYAIQVILYNCPMLLHEIRILRSSVA